MYTPKERVLVGHALLGALVWLCAGCATTNPSPRSMFEGTISDSDQDITVVVENLMWNDVVIYCIGSGRRVRLGTVTTGIESRFVIPRYQRLDPELRLIADPIGSPRVMRSGALFAAAGQVVRWTVHESPAIAELTVVAARRSG